MTQDRWVERSGMYSTHMEPKHGGSTNARYWASQRVTMNSGDQFTHTQQHTALG